MMTGDLRLQWGLLGESLRIVRGMAMNTRCWAVGVNRIGMVCLIKILLPLVYAQKRL